MTTAPGERRSRPGDRGLFSFQQLIEQGGYGTVVAARGEVCVRFCLYRNQASRNSGKNLKVGYAGRDQRCGRRGGQARGLSIAAGVVAGLFCTMTVSPAAAATYSINSGSSTPASLAPAQSVAIKARFSVSQAATVATYFEIRNAANALLTSKSYNSQTFAAGQVRTYTWSFTVPSTWPAGTYRVAAGMFNTSWSTTLQWAGSSSSFVVKTTSSTSTSTNGSTSSTSSTSSTGGPQFYVDNVSGSDSNSGRSSSAPWKSLATVNAATFHAGDTVNFKRGSVWTGNLRIRASGTAAAAITFQAYGSGTAPQIKNPGVSYGHAVDISGSYIVFHDFLLSDAHEAGLTIASNAVRDTIWKNEITRTGTGVMVAGQSNLVTGNYVHDLTMIVNDSTPSSDYGAVCFWLQAPNNEVSYNRGINCRASSHDFGYDGGFVEVWHTGDKAYIHHNYAENTAGFLELGSNSGGSAQNVKVAYNVIRNVRNSPVVCFNDGGYNINVTGFRFENNTVVAATDGSASRVFGCRDDLSALQVRNNIFYSNIQIANSGNFTRANNLYYMTGGSRIGYSMGSGELSTDPRFANMAGGDFRLQLTSPAIDAGVDLGYKKDFVDGAVPQAVSSLRPDIGAYEHNQH